MHQRMQGSFNEDSWANKARDAVSSLITDSSPFGTNKAALRRDTQQIPFRSVFQDQVDPSRGQVDLSKMCLEDTNGVSTSGAITRLKSDICEELQLVIRREIGDLKQWLKESFHPSSALGLDSPINSPSSSSFLKKRSKKLDEVQEEHDDVIRVSRSSKTDEPRETVVMDGAMKDSDTSLFWAVQNNDIKQARSLIAGGSDPNMVVKEYKPGSRTFRNCSLATISVMQKNIEMLRLLVESSAGLDTKYSFVAGSQQMEWIGGIVHAVPPTRNLEMLKELVQLQADVHDISSNNANMIWQCCYNKNEDMIEYLISLGVAVNIPAKSQDHANLSLTPLQTATRRGARNIVSLLVEAGAEVVENEEGVSALHDAISSWFPGILYTLVAHGAKLVENPADVPRASSRQLVQSRTIHGRQGTKSAYVSSLDLLLQQTNPMVWQSAALGLHHQEDQVRNLTTDDILAFLQRRGKAKSALLDAIFCEREIRFRAPEVLNEVIVRSAHVYRFQGGEPGESFVNAVATTVRYLDLEFLFKKRRSLNDEMESFLDCLVPTGKGHFVKELPRKLAGYRRDHVPIIAYESVVPDFHDDLRILHAIVQCPEFDFFESRPCQAIIWHSWEARSSVVQLDVTVQFLGLLIDIALSLEAHAYCRDGTETCSFMDLRTVALIALVFWAFSLVWELLLLYAHAKHFWLRSYFRLSFLNSFNYVRIASVILHGIVIFQILQDAKSSWVNEVRVSFATSCLFKGWMILVALTPFRCFGRPMVPVLVSIGDLWPLLKFFFAVCLLLSHFWIALDTDDSPLFSDILTNTQYFGMTADFGSVGAFRNPIENHVFMHVCLMLMTLFVPVILLNCTIASMSTSYANAITNVEKYYQQLLVNCTFRYTAILATVRQLRRSEGRTPKYLWYAVEEPVNMRKGGYARKD